MDALNWLALGAGVVLGVVFVVAGASKIAVGDQWNNGAADLGIPHWLSTVVPWTELIVGAFLIVGAVFGTPWPWPVWAALIMLAAFTVVLLRAVVTRDPTPCNCFGTRSQAPVGTMHLVRNGALIVLAVLSLYR